MHALVVEDSEISQKVMLKILTKFGYQATFLGNGQEALDYLADPRSPKPDIIFMDINMPVLDGINATQILRTQAPFAMDPVLHCTPIIGLGVSSLAQLPRDWYAERNFDDFLRKPFRMSEIRRALLRWSKGHLAPMPGQQPLLRDANAVQPQGLGLAGGLKRPGFVYVNNWGEMPLRKFRGPKSLL